MVQPQHPQYPHPEYPQQPPSWDEIDPNAPRQTFEQLERRTKRPNRALGCLVGVLVLIAALIGIGKVVSNTRGDDTVAAPPRIGALRVPLAPSLPAFDNPLAELEKDYFEPVDGDSTAVAAGTKVRMRDGNGNVLEMSVDNVRFRRSTCSSFTRLKNRGDGLLVARVSVKVLKGAVTMTEFDFGLRVSTRKAISAAGGMMADCGAPLTGKKMKPGKRYTGTLAFVVERKKGVIVWMPSLQRFPSATWKL
jgi:hypothetical protein